ncbi:MAG: hypothetical protein FD133_652 [Erysipelotrichaceae bacterium]|nr:MAG: hypothetical protein FD179_1323 [Erysipelotrichaceae bacterium]TXT18805.1 MAG: hypothetical protein FD133_652 [Erysipelotrichaceae bacterium]
MTNNDQFKDLIHQVDPNDVSMIDELIEHKVKRLRRNKHICWLSFPLSSIISLVLVFALLVNLNDKFYVYAVSNPILRPLTQLVNGRQDILSAYDSGYVQLIDKIITVGDYTLEVDSIISDTRSINMFYKVRYQGKLIDEFESAHHPSFEFMTLDGQSISYGYSYRHFENYWWTEVSLKNLNKYEPLNIKFTPDLDLAEQYGELQVNIDQTKVIQPVIVPINKTIVVGGQKLILKSLEMGAFSSQLTTYHDPENEKLLVLIVFKDFTSGVSWDDESLEVNYIYDNFPIGQLNHMNTFSLELKNASVLDRAYETVSFDPKTRTFSSLPEHLTLKEVIVNGNKYEIVLEDHQSVGNQGLMPVKTNAIDDFSWRGETIGLSGINEYHIELEIRDDKIVIFKVLGGTELKVLPGPIIIQLPKTN